MAKSIYLNECQMLADIIFRSISTIYSVAAAMPYFRYQTLKTPAQPRPSHIGSYYVYYLRKFCRCTVLSRAEWLCERKSFLFDSGSTKNAGVFFLKHFSPISIYVFSIRALFFFFFLSPTPPS